MDISTKEAWLSESAGDLVEAVVEDVPAKGQSVRVRGLSAAFSNQAASEALEVITDENGNQIAKVNSVKAEVIQFEHGVVEPKFNRAESQQIAEKFGPAFKKVIARIDELSGVDKASIEEAEATFRSAPAGEAGAAVAAGNSTGDTGPVVPLRAGA